MNKTPEEILNEWHSDLEGDIARPYNKSDIIGAMIEYAGQQVKNLNIHVVRKCCNAMCNEDADDGSVYCDFHRTI